MPAQCCSCHGGGCGGDIAKRKGGKRHQELASQRGRVAAVGDRVKKTKRRKYQRNAVAMLQQWHIVFSAFVRLPYDKVLILDARSTLPIV